MSKLYFYKCAQFHLLLSLSTIFIHHFHSYTKIITLFSLIATPNSPDSQHFLRLPHFPILIPRIPIIPILISRIPILMPRILIIPLILFPDSPFRLLQIIHAQGR